MRLQPTLAAVLLTAFAATSSAQTEPTGDYAVGFRSEWHVDHGRTYRTTGRLEGLYGASKAPRPILINVWYPARRDSGRAMTHGDYFTIESKDSSLSKLAAALRQYAWDIAATELLGVEAAKLTEADRAVVAREFRRPVIARRDAAAAQGRFPLVIYHAGAGSSFEDNAWFCEYLASHGFVVAGSAFLDQDGDTLNVDHVEGSTGDIRYLITAARSWPNVDAARIGLAGHSLGAQAAIFFEASGSSAVDAIISLDTTYDIHSLKTRWWSSREQAEKHPARVRAALMVVAPPTAIFELADTFVNSERYYLTVGGLGHNDFIVQGVATAEFRSRSTEIREDLRVKPEDAALIAKRYGQVVRDATSFLAGVLRKDHAALVRLRGRGLTTSDGEPAIEYLAAGETRTAPYEAGVPTPRQLRRYFDDQGIEATVELLRRFWQPASDRPIYEGLFAAIWLNDLHAKGRSTDARQLFKGYSELGGSIVGRVRGQLVGWADVLFKRLNRPDDARPWLETARLLFPDDQEVQARLEALPPKG
ncbi:MAG TPA: hypothetical protein VFS23_05835 [Vicinamibacterales bacterium]|nr:hypothetical protein [Vicinamibacterales bacterium]